MQYDAVIVLGHSYLFDRFSSRHLKRLAKGLELYRAGQVKCIILTGGKGIAFNHTETPLAIWTRDYLVKAGIPAKDIIPADKTHDLGRCFRLAPVNAILPS